MLKLTWVLKQDQVLYDFEEKESDVKEMRADTWIQTKTICIL